MAGSLDFQGIVELVGDKLDLAALAKIAQRLPLAQIVQAHELVESGRAVGNVVISLP